MRILLLALLFFSTSQPTLALKSQKFAYPPQRLAAAGIKQIQISGVKGRLKLKGTDTKFFKIAVSHSKDKQYEDWNLSVDRVGDALVLEVFNVALGPQWKHSVKEELWPDFDIEIEGPSRPAVLSWREGELQVLEWKNDVEAAFLNGKFVARGMTGNLKLQAIESDVEIRGHQGHLDLRGEKGTIQLAQIKGSVSLNWLHGQLSGDDLRGPLNLDLDAGQADLKNLTGPLKAKGLTTSWLVEASAPSEVEVDSQSGPVKIRWGLGGAKLFLSSLSGPLKVPKRFLIESRDGFQVVRQAEESKPRGVVFVRTQSGAISWQ